MSSLDDTKQVASMVLQWPSRMLRLSSLSPATAEDEEQCTWSSPLGLVMLGKMPISMILLHISVIAITLLSGAQLKSTPQHVCISHDQPNPIYTRFPNNATGVLNTTLAIVPISLAAARRIVPAQYGILENAYRALLPDFPAGMYPVLVQAGHDHDIRFQEYRIADFSRAGYEFPFIDLLNDGYSAFRWAPEQLIEAANADAVLGSEAYGTVVHPGVFEPECNAYGWLPDGRTYFNGSAVRNGVSKFMSVEFTRTSAGRPNPYPTSFFRNITNQPIFADLTKPSCDNMIRLFDTSLSTGENAPVEVRGQVVSNLGPFKETTEFDDIYGIQITTPFIENNYLDCSVFKGYRDNIDYA